jgi:hypothetical protein
MPKVDEAPVLDIAAGQELPPLPVREKRYLVKTKNPDYSGRSFGIKFERGQAIVEKLTIDSRMGRSVEEIAWHFKNDFHYEVTEIT